jgi:hypothetical protein
VGRYPLVFKLWYRTFFLDFFQKNRVYTRVHVHPAHWRLENLPVSSLSV